MTYYCVCHHEVDFHISPEGFQPPVTEPSGLHSFENKPDGSVKYNFTIDKTILDELDYDHTFKTSFTLPAVLSNAPEVVLTYNVLITKVGHGYYEFLLANPYRDYNIQIDSKNFDDFVKTIVFRRIQTQSQKL